MKALKTILNLFGLMLDIFNSFIKFLIQLFNIKKEILSLMSYIISQLNILIKFLSKSCWEIFSFLISTLINIFVAKFFEIYKIFKEIINLKKRNDQSN